MLFGQNKPARIDFFRCQAKLSTRRADLALARKNVFKRAKSAGHSGAIDQLATELQNSQCRNTLAILIY